MAAPAPANRPSVAIARVLRGLGLHQGVGDFRVAGIYRRGERIGTQVVLRSRHANEIVANNADLIEELALAQGFTFRVDVFHVTAGGHPLRTVDNEIGQQRRLPVPATTAEFPATPNEEQTATEAPAVGPRPTYGTVRRYLGRRFHVSKSSPNGRRWSEGVQVRTLPGGAVRVSYTAGHTAFYPDGSHWMAKLTEVREYLSDRYDVADCGTTDGSRLLVTQKTA
ncbi:hypothetical protein [Kitasatospora fiedleri]|uniref:hypothetical protein n=1 Tax=Kitasatospora fiedleri TaxID=2991545 RepID=UPI00249B523A|nr:hypothetical protein [Kitasatospora fiedleri]